MSGAGALCPLADSLLSLNPSRGFFTVHPHSKRKILDRCLQFCQQYSAWLFAELFEGVDSRTRHGNHGCVVVDLAEAHHV